MGITKNGKHARGEEPVRSISSLFCTYGKQATLALGLVSYFQVYYIGTHSIYLRFTI